MIDPELLHAMRGAVAGCKGCFSSGRVVTPTYSVAFNGTGFLVTCARNVVAPRTSVLVCESETLLTHFIPFRENASAEIKM
jgi:hypothetical protein